MFKAVVIDDEPIIIQGLSRVMNWKEYGCQLVGTAYNGTEGIELIHRVHPDIIISDIAMPGIDGLQMIASIRIEQPDAMITILTAHRDFDYAQKAIQLGVCRFLLKPSNFRELEEAMTFMTGKLKKSKLQNENRDVPDDFLAEKSTGAASSFLVRNAIEYMERHYSEKLSLSDLADKLYVSQWHLSKLLNHEMQKGYSELLNEIRIREAQKLLKDTTLRVSEIAEAVGFCDITHFTKTFKKYTNMSAREYRDKKGGYCC